jgi:aminopeptidase N
MIVCLDTSTVYSKGAEVVGLYRTWLGCEGFKKGLKLYFLRHDGSAVTCDDFRHAMAGGWVPLVLTSML